MFNKTSYKILCVLTKKRVHNIDKIHLYHGGRYICEYNLDIHFEFDVCFGSMNGNRFRITHFQKILQQNCNENLSKKKI